MGKKCRVEKKFYSTDEIASELGVGRDHVTDLIQVGKLRAVNVGKGDVKPRYRISAADYQDFIEAGSTGKPSQKPPARQTVKTVPPVKQTFV